MHLGILTLVEVFEAVPTAQEGLLREIQSKLVGVKEETSLPFVAILAQLVHKHPRTVLQHAELLKVGRHNLPGCDLLRHYLLCRCMQGQANNIHARGKCATKLSL